MGSGSSRWIEWGQTMLVPLIGEFGARAIAGAVLVLGILALLWFVRLVTSPGPNAGVTVTPHVWWKVNEQGLAMQLKHTVARMLELDILAHGRSSWGHHEDPATGQVASMSILGFAVFDDQGRRIGQFDGYVRLYGETTPQEFVNRVESRPSAERSKAS